MIHSYVDSPLGPLLVVGDGESLTGLYTDKHGRLPTDLGHRADEDFAEVRAQLQEYFAGAARRLRPAARPARHRFPAGGVAGAARDPLRLHDELRRGRRAIGNPKAIRAVGSANGRNPISIIVPCHRVVGSDGKLIGYAGGFSAKHWLLDHELRTAGALAAVG